MIFGEDYLKTLPTEPLGMGYKLCLNVLEQISHDEYPDDAYETLTEAYALYRALAKKYGWEFQKTLPLSDRAETVRVLRAEFNGLRDVFQKLIDGDKFAQAVDYYERLIGEGFVYELTDGDVARIQELINELRMAITECSVLEEGHVNRLLSRLEKLQAELHKKMSDYDRFYGLLVDGIILVEKFGRAVQPITELIKEIGNLFWRAQARAEQLSGDTKPPLLRDVNE